MTYHISRSPRQAAAGIRPLVAYKGGSLGVLTAYSDGVATIYDDSPVTLAEMDSFTGDLAEIGVDVDDWAYDSEGDGGDYMNDPVAEGESDDDKKKKMMMIAGGVGAVVLIAGIAVVVVTRK